MRLIYTVKNLEDDKSRLYTNIINLVIRNIKVIFYFHKIHIFMLIGTSSLMAL